MKRSLLVGACVLGIFTATSAMAQNEGKQRRNTTTGQAGDGYSYCLKTDIGPGDCKYTSMQQCQTALSGIGGDCVKNVGAR